MATIQSHDQLAEDAPDKAFLRSLALVLQVFDYSTEVTIPAVLHVKMKVLADFQVLAVIIGDDVGVSKM